MQASETPIIVFQMGKVGSTAVVEGLKAHAPNDVFHIHRMNPDRRAPRGRGELRDKEYLGSALFHHVFVQKRKALVVMIVRDPIARNLSAYFHHDATEPTVEGFVNGYNHGVPEKWFDYQMLPATGIDVFNYPFDHERGWMVIEHPQWPVLVLRAETPDDTRAAALAEFTGFPITTLPAKNTAADRGYSDAYTDFKRHLELPEAFVDRLLSMRYVRHFYSDVERDEFRDRWTAT